MSLISYVVASDTGFAPNPYWGFCTLATCKPKIRKTAKVGDWILGTGSSRTVGSNRLVYAMKVSEVMDFDSYYRDVRFNKKKPKPGSSMGESGDNMYYKDADGRWQRDAHSCRHLSDEQMEHDTNVDRVLVAKEFYYFGGDAIAIPIKFSEVVKKGPGHKSDFSPTFVDDFVRWLKGVSKEGVHGGPSEERRSVPLVRAGLSKVGNSAPRGKASVHGPQKIRKC